MKREEVIYGSNTGSQQAVGMLKTSYKLGQEI
jgi:hypothetical protein